MRADTSESQDLTKMIEDHLPLVKHIVFQVAVHFPRHVDRDELARAGALGLVEAARRYDEERGVPFDRYAAQRIRGAILDAVRAADWAPRSVRTLARKLESVEQRLASQLGRVPGRDEMAEALGMTRAELARLQDRMFRSVVLALEHEVSDDSDEDLTLVDVLRDRGQLEPLEELEKRELHAYLRDAVELLPERQRLVVVGYFLEGRTSQELARFLGVTESRISQLRSEALAMLKDGIEAQYGGAGAPREQPAGRVARRKAGYALAISEASPWRNRLTAVPVDRFDSLHPSLGSPCRSPVVDLAWSIPCDQSGVGRRLRR
jgi:RNA polymerase sigma factor FliA